MNFRRNVDFISASKELTVVAELASLSAGEDPLEIDRVKCFHDAAFGYAPFIYELQPGNSVNSVYEACGKFFKQLARDPKLPEKYADSARNQAWFEKALKTQGSVEKSSWEKVLMISRSGVYKIGHVDANKRKMILCPEDVVDLTYKEVSTSVTLHLDDSKENRLNLPGLQDLLSKLMLILGQEKHENAEKVDQFITNFQNVERLASAFVSLNNSGCSFFERWQAVIRMNPTDKESMWEIHYQGGSLKSLDGFSKEPNAELSLLCLALESIKQKWYDYVFRMRIKHPVLNCFNIQQLKTISHNLAQSKKSQDSIDYDTFYLLHSLNLLKPLKFKNGCIEMKKTRK